MNQKRTLHMSGFSAMFRNMSTNIEMVFRPHGFNDAYSSGAFSTDDCFELFDLHAPGRYQQASTHQLQCLCGT